MLSHLPLPAQHQTANQSTQNEELELKEEVRMSFRHLSTLTTTTHQRNEINATLKSWIRIRRITVIRIESFDLVNEVNMNDNHFKHRI